MARRVLPSRAAILPGRGVTCVGLSASCERCSSESLNLRPAPLGARTWPSEFTCIGVGRLLCEIFKTAELNGHERDGDWKGPVG